MGPPTEFVPTSSRLVTLCSKEDEFSRELPPGIQMRSQRLWPKPRKWAMREQETVENVIGISREINLAATFWKPPPTKLRSFEVEQTRH